MKAALKTAFIILALLFAVAPVHAADMYAGKGIDLGAPSTEISGIDFVQTPNILPDSTKSYTVIEAEVDNIGFETVLISLPKGWEFKQEVYGATGAPIIKSWGELKRKYGDPGDRSSFQRNNFVFTSPGNLATSRGSPVTIAWDTGEGSVGWYIRPNERLSFVIKMIPSDAEAIIDPLALEQNRSDIIVNKWNQEFMVFPDPDTPTGFLAAPWIVKDATMVEATPGVFANLSHRGGDFYWNKFKLENQSTTTTTLLEPEAEEVKELNPPAWDAWFSSSGLFGLKQTNFASIKTDFLPIPEINKTEVVEEDEVVVTEEKSVFIPVWLIDMEFYQSNSVGTTSGAAIRYVYEWSRGKDIEGVDVTSQAKPYVTLTERYGETPPTSVPITDESVSTTPELDLTIVPEWYTWFN